jgi:cell division protease FtsH
LNPKGRNLFIWLAIVFGAMALYNSFSATKPVKQGKVSYSEMIRMVENKEISEILIKGTKLSAVRNNGEEVTTLSPFDPDMVKEMRNSGVNIVVEPSEEGRSLLMTIFLQLLPFALIIAVWVFFIKQMQGGGKGAMSFGKSKAQMLTENQIKVNFDDVAGVEEAKQELREIVEFLKDPSKFQRLGGKLPKGALLMGQPGTGKTLLARSVAGEAGVPFFSISGSDFVEMFVGVGASRVRDLFEQGKKNSPCIIFIDEIDAVGRHRGAGVGGGNDEREQTLNQLLVEMDGFDSNEGVILIAATNRPDVLDPALLRPGRFDRQIVVPLPDILGREQILTVHMRKIPVAADVDASILARGTPGFSGADLANLVNEAALTGARENKRLVDMADFESAKDKVMMGAERKSAVMTDDQKKTTAYHEAGHAIATLYVDGPADPLHKVTIIPRGRALGVTMSLPEEDRVTYDKRYLENQITILMGGRLAEEMILNQLTTGASNDIERASDLAHKMVCSWGMSEKMGPRAYTDNQSEVFLGRDIGHQKQMSEAIAADVDDEINKFIHTNYDRCKKILKKHMDKLHLLAESLLEHETLDGKQIDDLFAGKKIIIKKSSHHAKRTAKKDDITKKASTAKKEPAKKTKTVAKKAKKKPAPPKTKKDK